MTVYEYSICNLKGEYITINLGFHDAHDIGLLFLKVKEAWNSYDKKTKYIQYTDHLNRKITVSVNSVIVLGEEIKKLLESKEYGFDLMNSEINKIYFGWVAKHSNNYANPNVKVVEFKNEDKPILRPASEVREIQTKHTLSKIVKEILVKISEKIDLAIDGSNPCISFTHPDLTSKCIKEDVFAKLKENGYQIETKDIGSETIYIHW